MNKVPATPLKGVIIAMLVLTITFPEVNAGLGLSRYNVDAQVLIGTVESIPFVRIYNNEDTTLIVNFVLDSNLSNLDIPVSITMEPDTSRIVSVEVDASDIELELGKYSFEIEIEAEPTSQSPGLSPVVPGGTVVGFITVYELNIIEKIAKRWDVILAVSITVIAFFVVWKRRQGKGRPKKKKKRGKKPKQDGKRRIRRIIRGQ